SRIVVSMARVARGRLATISDLAAALSNARTRQDVTKVLLDQGMRVAGADTCTLYMLDDSGAALDLIGHRRVAPELVANLRRITPASQSSNTLDGALSGTPMWVENEDDYARTYPQIANAAATGRRARAFWSLPLVVEGHSIGLLGMGFYERRAFPAEERAFI